MAADKIDENNRKKKEEKRTVSNLKRRLFVCILKLSTRMLLTFFLHNIDFVWNTNKREKEIFYLNNSDDSNKKKTDRKYSLKIVHYILSKIVNEHRLLYE